MFLTVICLLDNTNIINCNDNGFERLHVSYVCVRTYAWQPRGRRKLQTAECLKSERVFACFMYRMHLSHVTKKGCENETTVIECRKESFIEDCDDRPEVWAPVKTCLSRACSSCHIYILVCHVRERLWGIALSSLSTNSFLVLLECMSWKKGKVAKLVSCVTL